jgi:hypothetical protein
VSAPTSTTTISSPTGERLAGVELAQQARAHVESLAERLLDRFVAEPLELGALHHVGGNRRERTLGVGVADRMHREQGPRVGAQRLPGVGIDAAARLEAASGLECGDGAPHVGAEATVDLAGRKPRAIEQRLGANDSRPLRPDRERRGFARRVESLDGALRVDGRGWGLAVRRRPGATAGGNETKATNDRRCRNGRSMAVEGKRKTAATRIGTPSAPGCRPGAARRRRSTPLQADSSSRSVAGSGRPAKNRSSAAGERRARRRQTRRRASSTSGT